MSPQTVASDLSESRTPRLLVSVRNVEEAEAAIRGGCDILDVKEPHRGSLGMAAPDVLQRISDFARSQAPQVLLTAALGEVYEYRPSDARKELPATLPALDFVKLGTARLRSASVWQKTVQATRAAITRTLSPATEWVAVAYADWKPAEAPCPDDVISEALDAGCRGVLFDTYGKTGHGLLDWMSIADMQSAARRLHARGLFLALAGSLKFDDLAKLQPVAADIIAIRGAACVGGLRTDSICESAVRDFQAALQR